MCSKSTIKDIASTPDAKDYIEKYCIKHHVDYDTALTHSVIIEYLNYLKERNN